MIDASEMDQVVRSLDQLLKKFRPSDSNLSAAHTRARKMLSMIRSEIAETLPDASSAGLTDHEVAEIMRDLDQIVGLFRKHEGHLTVAQVRALTMLSVVRLELAQTLVEANFARNESAEPFIIHSNSSSWPRLRQPGPRQTATPARAQQPSGGIW
jgi:hypothetical protein